MGCLRFSLAIIVLLSHCLVSAQYLPDGRTAVCIFYVISGFYMTLVLNTKYREANKTFLFYSNRYLRLWPCYLLSLFLLLALVLTTGKFIEGIMPLKIIFSDLDSFRNWLANLPLWAKLHFWFSNISMLGTDLFFWFKFEAGQTLFSPIDTNQPGRFEPAYIVNRPTFTLSIEIIFYLLAPFVVKSAAKCLILFLFFAAYHLAFLIHGNASLFWTYHFAPAAWLYFMLGSLVWHGASGQYPPVKRFLENKLALFGAAILGLLFLLGLKLDNYLLPAAAALVIVPLFNLTRHHKGDKFLGDLSYPIYILHFPLTAYMTLWVTKDWLWLAVLLPTLLLALIATLCIEQPIDRWRQSRLQPRRT